MNNKYIKAFRAAFPQTIPVLTGFLFVGIAYGIYMNTCGYSYLWTALVSLTVYAGSAQFVLANLLVGAFNPLQAFLMILMLNARHLFYGISMLEPFKGTGWKKPLLIFWMSDETFSINYSTKIPSDVDKGWFMLSVSVLNYLYWLVGSVLGGIIGDLIPFDTTGIDFVMTAMFIVIFLEQLLSDRSKYSEIAGLALSLISLAVFGKDSFVIPALAAILVVLTILRQKLDSPELYTENEGRGEIR